MKPPKEPKTFKYPRMYASFADVTPKNCRDYCRLRIIEPSGKSIWFSGCNGFPSETPCWHSRKIKTGAQAVKALKAYCSDASLDCVYIGEIK